MNTREQGYLNIQEYAGDNLISTYNDYANERSLLTFSCSECNKEIESTAYLYVKDIKNKLCSGCTSEVQGNKLEWVANWEAVHGKYYDYSHVPIHVTQTDYVEIICPKHGLINIRPQDHITAGCVVCKTEQFTKHEPSTQSKFTVEANRIHKFRYRYDEVNYCTDWTPVTIICPKHGEFEQPPAVHLRGTGCTICNATATPLSAIKETLRMDEIEYVSEKMFTGCIGVKGKTLRFDIYIPLYNLCIEYDGIHHYQPTKYTPDITDEQAENYLKIQQENDAIKDKFCSDHNINFIRVPYTEYHPDNVVMKHIDEMCEEERYIHTWKDFGDDVRNISSYINSFNYSDFAVYGISRGGLPHAVHVSNHYEGQCEFGIVNFQRYDGKSKEVEISIEHKTGTLPIFVIDDLISSGETMNMVTTALQDKYPEVDIHPIVIYGDENDNGVFYLRQHPHQWIVFPYEM